MDTLAPENLPRSLKVQRAILGLTQADVAKVSGRCVRSVSALENGRVRNAGVLFDTAPVYRLSPAQVLAVAERTRAERGFLKAAPLLRDRANEFKKGTR